MPFNGQTQFNNSNEISTLNGEIYSSGDKSVNYRLGLVNGFSAFGLTSTKIDIDNSQFWANEYGIPVNDLDITFPSSAITLGIASSSINDTSAGSGAQSLQIVGLDADYNEIFEIISLNGQTEVNSTKEFLRVNNAIVFSFGSTGWNEGTIYIGGSDNTFTSGLPNINVFRTIGVDIVDGKGIGASNPSTYTMRRGTRACPLNFKVATDATTSKPLLVRGIVKPFGLGEITIGNLTFNGSVNFTFDGFTILEEKSDIIVRVRAKSTNVGTSAVFWEWVTVDTDKLNI